MNNTSIRLATPEDAATILSIYRPYITDTVITFEYEVPSIDEFLERITLTLADYPYLVYTINNEIVGYAYAHRLRERAAYQWDAELSVYLDTSVQHKGIGRQVYKCLIELLKLQHIVTVYGVVTVPNPASEKLHEALGFERTGYFKATGFKFGRWIDVAWYEKVIADHPTNPEPFLPFPTVDQTLVSNILTEYTQSN